MSHANVDLLRQAYADFARGDLDAFWGACASDFAFHVPGNNAVAGTYAGHDAFFGMIGPVMQLSGGAFEETVEDVLANDRTGVVLVRHRFPRGGQQREYQSAHVYSIRDGRLSECWEQPRNQVVFDDAWGQKD
jgi:ketosteroid isomerase-like protein